MRARRASTKALRSVFAPSIAPGRSEGQAARERRASEFLRQFEERRQNRRMQVKCLCAVTWSSVRPVARKASNWARTSARICLRTWGGKNTAAPESAIFARNRPRIDQIWDRRRRQRRFGLDHSSFDPVGSAANWGIDPESKASILAKIVYRPRRHSDALGTAL
jgi:hypothetical protein